ncbi:MAG: hypothetical protein K0R25_1100 [Rickettsiaceae bacterium]|nr:hypothetical protein [Rickettsiaceae bacterium]
MESTVDFRKIAKAICQSARTSSTGKKIISTGAVKKLEILEDKIYGYLITAYDWELDELKADLGHGTEIFQKKIDLLGAAVAKHLKPRLSHRLLPGRSYDIESEAVANVFNKKETVRTVIMGDIIKPSSAKKLIGEEKENIR